MTLHGMSLRRTSKPSLLDHFLAFMQLRELPIAPVKEESVVMIGPGVVVVGFIRNAAVLEVHGELETEALNVQRLVIHPGGLVNAPGLVQAKTFELGGRIVADAIEVLDALTITETGVLSAKTTIASRCIAIREGARLSSYVRGGPSARTDEDAPSLPSSTLAPA